MCKNCTTGEIENIDHILFQCSKYNELRLKFLHNNTEFITLLSQPNETTMKNIYLFLKNVAESQNCQI